MKRRRKGIDEVVRERRAREDSRRLVVESSHRLERPKPDPQVVGLLPHFLERTERLGDEARTLALRFYYDHALCRFVARRALGLEPEIRAHEEDRPDEVERRAVLDLEPGESPGRLVVDGRGLLVTCLAPGMEVEWGERVSFAALEGHLEAHAAWLERQAEARRLAEGVDFAELGRLFEGAGFWAPREALILYETAGPAVAPLLAQGLAGAARLVRGSYRAACSPASPRTDRAIRRWLETEGLAAVWLTLHADLWLRCEARPVRRLLGVVDPIAALLVGASVARWPRAEGLAALMPPSPGAPSLAGAPLLTMSGLAASTYATVTKRLLDALTRSPEDEGIVATSKAQLDSVLTTVLGHEETWFRGAEGDPEGRELHGLVRDVALLGLGETQAWGPDLDVDPADLPPPRVEELCAPGGGFSVRPLRQLALRLVATFPEDPLAFFWTADELEAWQARLGAPRPRSGRFLPPFVPKGEPLRARPAPGRNDPCPCGSGKKYKKCCLLAPAAGAPKEDEA